MSDLRRVALQSALSYWPLIGSRLRVPTVPCSLSDEELLERLRFELDGAGSAPKPVHGHPGVSANWSGGEAGRSPWLRVGEHLVAGEELLELVRQLRKISRPNEAPPAPAVVQEEMW